MKLMGLVEWEEWKWEEQVQAFPALTELILFECNLKRLPPGLASQAVSQPWPVPEILSLLPRNFPRGTLSVPPLLAISCE